MGVRNFDGLKMLELAVSINIDSLDASRDDAFFRWGPSEPLGSITSVAGLCDEKSHSESFGFVFHALLDEVIESVTEMHLKLVKGEGCNMVHAADSAKGWGTSAVPESLALLQLEQLQSVCL